MGQRRAFAGLAVALALHGHARADGGIPIVNVSPAFRPGPYASLTVDPADPRVIGVGTSDGHVAWSTDAGTTSREEHVNFARQFSVMILRGMPRYSLYSRTPLSERAYRLFVAVLRSGLTPTRWAYWMAYEDTMPDVTAIGMGPGAAGRMFAAGPMGVSQSDRQKGVWTKALGGMRPRQNDLIGYSVAIDPADENHVLVGTDRGLMVSVDGGYTFQPHPDDKQLGPDDPVIQVQFDANDPNNVMAVTTYSIYQSGDRGQTFQSAFSAQSAINSVVLTQEGGYIATAEGLYVSGAEGEVTTAFKDQNVIGAIPLGDGNALVATDLDLYVVAPTGEKLPLMHTIPTDPFLKLGGRSDLAWAMTRYGLYRIGMAEDRARAPKDKRRYPKVVMSELEVEHAVQRHLGIPDAGDIKFADRWYAKLLPVISVEVDGSIEDENYVWFDGTFPISYRQAQGMSRANVPQFYVWAQWDLSKFIFGSYSNVSNPFAFLESRIKPMRLEINAEVRWRYREAVNLVNLLQNPPTDPVVDLNWRMRLEEHQAYLEELCGRQVILMDETEAN